MFDLEKAIAAWRRSFTSSRAFFPEDRMELESHLRDHIEERLEEGHSEEEAFRMALRELGDYGGTEAEYRKVFWTKLKHQRKLLRELIWRGIMLKNYLKVAFRNLRSHKGYSLINISGLGIGLACCFLIVLFVQHELSYDQFHSNSDRLYRMLLARQDNPADRKAVTASGYAPLLEEAFPEVEEVVRFFMNSPTATLGYDSENRRVGGVAYADENVFKAFDFSLVRGNPETALQTANSIVLTEAAATSWFGEKDPVGETFTFFRGSNRLELQVTGILEEVPSNSHLQFDYLISFRTLKAWMGEDALHEFTNSNYYTYVLLTEGVRPDQLARKFPDFIRTYRGEESRELPILQPLADIHFTTDVMFDIGTNSDERYLYIFSMVAVFVLLIASINFMNLSTARAAKRAKEVGVRKAVGAHRRQLIWQFFGESILASVFAIVLAFVLLALGAPLLNVLIGREITFEFANSWTIPVTLIGIGLLTGLISGGYPAFVLSSFNPAVTLKGLKTRGKKGNGLRKGLIVVQFAISVFLIVAVTTIYRQLDYMKSLDLGFQKEQVVYVNLSGPVKERFETFRQMLLRNPSIQHVGITGNRPGSVNTNRGYKWPGTEEEEGKSFYSMFVDQHSVEALDLEFVAGRNFSADIETDVSHGYILNETAVRELGWTDPVGMPFRAWDDEMGQVIGVVKDFHYQSLHQEIGPIVLDMKPGWSWTAAIRVAPGNLAGTMDYLGQQWKAMEPELPLVYRFLDEEFDRLYRDEEQLGNLFGYFTSLAILIACLGLFGLAAFVAEQRTKEIGIRKVLGASVGGVVMLLSRDFVWLVVVAIALSAPLAYLAMDRWLQDFAYRMEVGVVPFIVAGGLAILIAWLTVSYQSIKAAVANPIQALRYE